MPIRPMDMQVLLPKVQKTHQGSQVNLNRNEQGVQQKQAKTKETVEVNKKKVAEFEATKGKKINKETKSGSKNNKKKKKKKKGQEEEANGKPKARKKIDMRI